MNEDKCICEGNWRQLVGEYRDLFGRHYTDGKDTYTFFGLVHADDDYYYGMSNHRTQRTQLLSCVGHIETFGYKLKEPT